MPFWGHNRWKATPDAEFPVSPRNNVNIREAEYRLSVGEEVYLTQSNGAKVTKLEQRECFSISPGQFAFIMTEETLNLSRRTIGFISVKASVKFLGLVNVSGFHVDPGYKGKLIFAVFNSGPKRISIQRGEAIFCLWLADIEEDIPEDVAPKVGYDHIPVSIINGIDGNHLTAYQLSERLERVEGFFASLKVWGLVSSFFVVLFLGPVLVPAIGESFKSWRSILFPTNLPVQETIAPPPQE